MRMYLATALVISMPACTAPDISEELIAANTLLEQTSKPLKAELGPKAAAEFAALEEVYYSQGKKVVEIVGTCDLFEARAKGLARSDCKLRSLIDPGRVETNATAVLQAHTVLEGYFGALTVLSKADGTNEIEKQAGVLVSALKQTGQVQVSSFQKLSDAATEHGDLAVAAAGFAADQYRLGKLRQVVRRADPVIGRMTSIAAAYLDEASPELFQAAEELNLARLAVEEAILAKDPIAHKRAVKQLKKAFTDFKKAEANALVAGFLSLRELHAKLLRKLNGTASLEEIQAVLDDISELKDLIEA